MQTDDIKAIISALELKSHPEGGYYKETYRSDNIVQRDDGERQTAGTAIYFLLPSNICTKWHRMSSDELWHFYQGDKLVLEIIDPDGQFTKRHLGNKMTGSDADFQALVPANCWQRAYSTGAYTLVGCTVAPGFKMEDFEMLEKEELCNRYPAIATKIKNDPFSDS